jgi:amino acid permease
MTFAGGIAVILLYIIFKIVKKTKWIKPEEADLSQGLASK